MAVKTTGALALLSLLLATSAAATPRIIIVSQEQATPLQTRLQAELTSLGFATADVPSHPVTASALFDLARQQEALAAIQIEYRPQHIVISVADRVTGKIVIRQLKNSEEKPYAESLVVLQIVELLRASLLEMQMDRPSQGEVKPGRVVTNMTKQDATRPLTLSLSAGAGVTFGDFARQPALQLATTASLELNQWLALQALALLPVGAVSIHEKEGSAKLWNTLVGAGPVLQLEPHPQLTAFAGGGVACGLLYVQGFARGDRQSGESLRIGAVPYLTLGAAAELPLDIGIKTLVTAGWHMPRTVIRFAKREVSVWGQPLIAGMFMVEYFF